MPKPCTCDGPCRGAAGLGELWYCKRDRELAAKTARNPLERTMLFISGFGDGAKGSAIKHELAPDYMEGWEQGRKAMSDAAGAFRTKHGLPPALILRTQDVGGRCPECGCIRTSTAMGTGCLCPQIPAS